MAESTVWYLRGDLGYSFNKLRGANFFQGSNATKADFATIDLKDSFSLGAVSVTRSITTCART